MLSVDQLSDLTQQRARSLTYLLIEPEVLGAQSHPKPETEPLERTSDLRQCTRKYQ